MVYFADTRMKTKDKSFAGFPACWNMVVLVLFATQPGEMVILLVVILLTVTMFTNLKFIHPVRTKRWYASLAAGLHRLDRSLPAGPPGGISHEGRGASGGWS